MKSRSTLLENNQKVASKSIIACNFFRSFRILLQTASNMSELTRTWQFCPNCYEAFAKNEEHRRLMFKTFCRRVVKVTKEEHCYFHHGDTVNQRDSLVKAMKHDEARAAKERKKEQEEKKNKRRSKPRCDAAKRDDRQSAEFEKLRQKRAAEKAQQELEKSE